ncbi:MAG: hypothetical protein V4736_06205 [Bdellovibrionota bacterium]
MESEFEKSFDLDQQHIVKVPLQAGETPLLSELSGDMSFETFQKDQMLEGDLKTHGLSSKVRLRARSALRFYYEAQVQVIRKQIGSLENVASELGLSQRKLAQLLLVDPSAVTRWSRPGEEPPPHIWRALQWYMALREKVPGLTPQYFLASNSSIRPPDADTQWRRDLRQQMESAQLTIRQLQDESENLKRSLHIYKRIAIATFIAVIIAMGFFLVK